MFSNKILIPLAPAVLLLSGCGSHTPEKKAAAQGPTVPVGVVEVRPATVATIYEATGTVRASSTSVLSARIMGYIRSVGAQAGDTVRAGQTVAVIDAKEIDDAVAQARAAVAEARAAEPEVDNAIAAAKAQLDLATSTLRRMKSLYDQKSITSQEFDEVQARHRMAEANHQMALAKRTQLGAKIAQAESGLAQASVNKAYMEVKAPFTGIVIERKAEPGMLATPGMPILIIEQAGAYRLEAAVEESRIATIKAGSKVKVRLDSLDREIEARVSEIVPAMDTASRTFTARIDLPASPLIRSGLFGRALFPDGEKQAMAAPASSIREQGQIQIVFVADGGMARARMIKTGAKLEGGIEVISGLMPGDRIVANPPAALSDGAKIEVRP
ncbi:MAG TPA: efflux RND transporter periplasmic adaptor subunit [Bryobacteraceae bacterium]|nr:efflux RND transporter periplasmic adaptor subunit [Bryobacteraceae bacterium]